jgi:hypothetical protein
MMMMREKTETVMDDGDGRTSAVVRGSGTTGVRVEETSGGRPEGGARGVPGDAVAETRVDGGRCPSASSTNAPGGKINARARRGQRRGVARTFLVASAYRPYSRPNILTRVSVDPVGSRHVARPRPPSLCPSRRRSAVVTFIALRPRKRVV